MDVIWIHMDIYKKYVFCVSSELDLNITVLDTGLNLGFFFLNIVFQFRSW